MIKLNLENAITDAGLEKYASKVAKINQQMERFESEGFEFLGWKDLPKNYSKREFKKILTTAKILKKEKISTLVVIGIGGLYLGAKAAIDFIQGSYPKKREMEVVFVGNSISSTDLVQKLNYVSNKTFAINVISKSGTTLEPALARLFEKLLKEKVGENNASKFIIATTDANNGALKKIASQNEYTSFVIPDNIGGRYSVLTPVGLFPMACVGINIEKIMDGAEVARKMYSTDKLSKNDAYKYAVARVSLSKKYSAELTAAYEPNLLYFNEWQKQLFGESEGKNGRGLLPTSAIFSTDLHSLGQFIQNGSKVLFETILTVKEPKLDINIFETAKNIDKLNYLSPKTIHEVNTVAFEAVTDAHVLVGKVPNIHIEIEKMNEKNLGQLFYFYMRAAAMSSYLFGVNPFNQPGVEIYKSNMFKVLGKPLL